MTIQWRDKCTWCEQGSKRKKSLYHIRETWRRQTDALPGRAQGQQGLEVPQMTLAHAQLTAVVAQFFGVSAFHLVCCGCGECGGRLWGFLPQSRPSLCGMTGGPTETTTVLSRSKDSGCCGASASGGCAWCSPSSGREERGQEGVSSFFTERYRLSIIIKSFLNCISYSYVI